MADLIAFTQLPAAAQVLEIGCGTGQATRSLVDRDIQLTCLEPSEPLRTLAEAHFASYANVRFSAESFEEYKHSGDAFHLIFAATSFHWLDPKVRMGKCADLLLPGGTLAMFSNSHPQPYTGFFSAVQEIYDRHVPEWSSPQKPGEKIEDQAKKPPAKHPLQDENFTIPVSSTYDWSVDLSADDYVRLLRTFSDHIRLGEDRLRGLTDDIRGLIKENYGGQVTRPYRSELYMAKRSKNP
jgi:SAM-dependent methyltransferase